MQLTFYGDKGKMPIIAEISRQKNATASIIQANIETIKIKLLRLQFAILQVNAKTGKMR